MQLTSPISSENLMQSRLGELGLQSIDVGGQVIVSLDLYHINYLVNKPLQAAGMSADNVHG